MSIHGGEFLQIADRYTNAEVEPQIAEALAAARAFNERLLIEDVSYEECVEMVHELNMLAADFIGSECSASGTMVFVDTVTEEGLPITTSTKHYDGLDIIFGGFDIGDLPTIIGDEDEVITARKIVCVIDRPLFTSDNEGDEEISGYSRGYAELHASVINFSDNVMTSERATSWLTYYYPELTNDLDERLYDDTHEDEAAAMLALKGLTVDVNKCVADGSSIEKKGIIQLCGAVELYIESFLEIDRDVPYAGALKGVCLAFDEVEEMFIEAAIPMNDIQGLFKINGVRLLPAIEMYSGESNVPRLFSIYLDVEYLRDDRTEPSLRLMVPIEACTELASVRQRHYKNKKS